MGVGRRELLRAVTGTGTAAALSLSVYQGHTTGESVVTNASVENASVDSGRAGKPRVRKETNRTFAPQEFTDRAWFEGATATDDGGALLVGGASGQMTRAFDSFLVRVGPDHETRWQQVSQRGRAGWATDAVQARDGGFVVVGRHRRDEDDRQSHGAWLLKVDRSGRPEWRKTFGAGGGVRLDSVVRAHERGYVAAGARATATDAPRRPFLVHAREDGTITRERQLSGDGRAVLRSIDRRSGGGYVCCGDAREGPDDTSGGFLLALTDSLARDWREVFHWRHGLEFADLCPVADGYVVAGGIRFENDNSGALVTKFDREGTAGWQWNAPTDRSTAATAVVPASEGFVVVANVGAVGATRRGPTSGLFLRIDADGSRGWIQPYLDTDGEFSDLCVTGEETYLGVGSQGDRDRGWVASVGRRDRQTGPDPIPSASSLVTGGGGVTSEQWGLAAVVCALCYGLLGPGAEQDT